MLLFLPLLLWFQAAFASPHVKIRDSPITISIAVRFNATGARNILKMDQARAQRFLTAAREKAALVEARKISPDAVIGVPITNGAVAYTASVDIGNPSTQYTLLIDTGSGNTWIDGTLYVRTSTSHQTGATVCLATLECGPEFTDLFSLGPGLVIQNQAFAVINSTAGQGIDGVLGLGPVDLTAGTLSTGGTIPTVTDELFSQGAITANEVSMSFEPTTSASVTNGEYTFGGTNSSKFTGSITFAPITTTSPASQFWGIDQSVRYGTATSILSTTAGIVDTGTTLVLIATDAFKIYQSASGGVLDNATGLLRLTTPQFSVLQSLFFTIDGTTFEFTANAQAWPRSLNALIGGTTTNVYLIVGDIGTPSGQGLDFINGFVFLERFYSVYDTANKRVGLATTQFTKATTN